jgi:hypothetical protein
MDTIQLTLQRSLTVLLCLACLIGLRPSASSQAAMQKNTKGSLLVAYFFPLTDDKVCVGVEQDYPVSVGLVKNEMGVAGATVSVNGRSVATSGPDGSANVPYTPNKEGKFTFTVSATKSGYTAGSTQIDGEAQECGWNIRMWYEETVHTDQPLVDADCFYKFDNKSFNKSDDGSLALTNGDSKITAKYGCDASGWGDIPLKITLQPEIQGEAQVQFSGSYQQGTLRITLQALSSGLPKTVEVQIIDILNPENKGQAVSWDLLPAANVIEQAKITNWSANSTFDMKLFKPSKSLFFPEKMRLGSSSGTVVVQRIKTAQ